MSRSEKPPRVGIDVSAISNSGAGISVYSREIVLRLMQNDWIFYLYNCNPNDLLNLGRSGIKIRPTVAKIKLFKLFWWFCLIPLMVRLDRLDAYWSPNQRLPFFMPKSTKKIATIHDLVYLNYPKTMTRRGRFLDSIFIPHIVRSADEIICVSSFVREEIEAKFDIKDVGLHVLPNGSKFEPETIMKGTETARHPFMLLVGTIEPRKNLERFLRAYGLLSKREQNSCSVIIAGGSGWGKQNWDKLLCELGIDEHVSFLKFVPDSELINLYMSCNFLVAPSIYEGFGLPIIEALRFNCKIVASDIPPFREIAEDFALYFNPTDVLSIRNALSHSISSGFFEGSASEKLDKKLRLYNWDKTTRSLANIMLAAIEKRN